LLTVPDYNGVYASSLSPFVIEFQEKNIKTGKSALHDHSALEFL